MEEDSKYYDNYYKNSEEYRLHYSKCMYYDLWLLILELIPKTGRITELGCGVGQFAKMLFDNGITDYIGYDFSREAIMQANKKRKHFFVESDLTERVFTSEDKFFVALEIFEHTDDLKIIENMRVGKEIIFSVPDFDYPGHVRFFNSIDEVNDRYKNVIKFESITKFKNWFICKGKTI